MSNLPPNAVDPHEVTQLIKDMLNVGKPQQPPSTAEVGLPNVSGTSVNGKTVADGMAGRHDSQNDTDILSCPEDTTIVSELSPSPQIIAPQSSDEQIGFSITSQDVTIVLGQNNHTSGSSKIKVQNIVDYGWEHKMYIGKLVCVHLSGTYIAYTLKVASAAGGVVRVLNYSSGERILLKGMKGQVKDLAFAHISSQIILAWVDDTGGLFVYEIMQKDEGLFSKCLLHVEGEAEFQKSDYHRVIWCPYIPEDPSSKEDPSDMSKLLVVTHDNKAEMWDIESVTKEYGSGPLKSENIKYGIQRIMEHEMPITDATFAPDGSALATASLDGEVKFFQVHRKGQDSDPRCLHCWKPHAGKPLSCLFFLDNHKNPLPDVQFWKFAVTGAENNREIKVWSCETWNCLQTIRFIWNGDLGQPCLKAEIDLSSSYLLLSEINRKVLYVLQLTQNPLSTVAHVTSVSEFPLSSPVLSLAVVSAARCKFKPSIGTEHIDKISNDCADGYGVDGEEELAGVEKYVEGTVLKAFWINTKSLQVSCIVYQSVETTTNHLSSSISTISQDSSVSLADLSLLSVSRDRLSDLYAEVQETEQPKSVIDSDIPSGEIKLGTPRPCNTSYFVHSPKSPLSSHNQSLCSAGEILLTPDDFTSPPLASSATTTAPAISTSFTSTSSAGSVLLPMTAASEDLSYVAPSKPTGEEESTVPLYGDDTDFALASEGVDSTRRKFSQHSSTSSPSQEVADIMAPKKHSLHEQIGKSEDQDLDSSTLEASNETSFSQVSVTNSTLLDHSQKTATQTKDWPDPPIPYKDFEHGGRANSFPCAVPKHSTPSGPSHTNTPLNMSLHNPPLLPVSFPEKDEKFRDEAIAKIQDSLESISSSLAVLTDAVKGHESMLREVQIQMKEPQMHQQIQNLEQRLDQLEESLILKLDQKVATQLQKELEKVNCSLSKREELDKQWFEKQSAVLMQSFLATLNTKIEKAIKNEVKATVGPQVTKFLESWKDTLQQELAQKLSPTDTYIKESVARLSKNKVFMESFGSSLAHCVQTHTQNASREVFQNVVIPAFEKVCHNLFSQLNETFQKGTKEYLHQIKTFQESSWQMFSNSAEKSATGVEHKITEATANLEKVLKARLSEFEEQLKNEQKESLNHFQELVLNSMKTILTEETSSLAWSHQATSVPLTARSRAVTPAAHQMMDPQVLQQHILQLLRQGHINTAFQQALSASNLSLVVAVCEAMKPNQIFNQSPCPLQQPVLLSLIQQLAADLSSHTELKLEYIKDAMMNLDTTNPITREHMTSVLKSLVDKLSFYLKSNPQSHNMTSARILILGAQSVMNS